MLMEVSFFSLTHALNKNQFHEENGFYPEEKPKQREALITFRKKKVSIKKRKKFFANSHKKN